LTFSGGGVKRYVTLIVVHSVDAMRSTRPGANVIQKGLETGTRVAPFLANTNTTAPIVFVCHVFRIITPNLHHVPDGIFFFVDTLQALVLTTAVC
jgi:hypothetical protein